MKKHRSLGRRISIIVTVMLIASMTFIGIFSYYLYRRDSIAVSADKARAIAMSVAASVDGDRFRAIMDSGIEDEYWYEKKQSVDETVQRTNVAYLYLLDKKFDSNVKYFMEGVHVGNDDDYGLGDEEPVSVHADELFETLQTGESLTTEIYDSMEYGMMVSGFAAIFDSDGAVAGVVGVDINIDDVLALSQFFGLIIIASVVLFSAVFGLLSRYIIQSSVGKPIAALSLAAGKIARGDMDIAVSAQSHDEIGVLTEAFLDMADSAKKQVAVLERIAEGDLTAVITPRCAQDTMSLAIIKTVDGLNGIFREITYAVDAVRSGSSQIADGAQVLAQGATEQSAAVDQLSASIGLIERQTGESAAMADKAASLSGAIRDNAEKGSVQMDSMMEAVREINEAGYNINKVIKVIDDIAFQTNILALNASVEAARAGQHGKGFAVVADEVRNLASKSAEAAKDTGSLIANSVEKAELGARIADETAVSLSEIVSGIIESNKLISDIANSSGEQARAVALIDRSVQEVSQVVQQNSAAAEESAAASEEMSGQANMLENLVARFKLRN